jgi:FMN reductase
VTATETPSIVGIVGNPRPASRTLEVTHVLAETLATRAEAPRVRVGVVDLAAVAAEIFDERSETVRSHVEDACRSDVLIIASPTYRGTFTGLAKAFLDRLPRDALTGVVAIPLMVGAGDAHAGAPDAHLGPILLQLGATVLPGLYLLETQLADPRPAFAAWSAGLDGWIGRALDGRPHGDLRLVGAGPKVIR